jgi:hypothetical protein
MSKAHVVDMETEDGQVQTWKLTYTYEGGVVDFIRAYRSEKSNVIECLDLYDFNARFNVSDEQWEGFEEEVRVQIAEEAAGYEDGFFYDDDEML